MNTNTMPKSAPRQRTVALRPEVYERLRLLAQRDNRKLGATIERLLTAAEVWR